MLPFGPERQSVSSFAQIWFCRSRSSFLIRSFTSDAVWKDSCCESSGEERFCLEMMSLRSALERPNRLWKSEQTGLHKINGKIISVQAVHIQELILFKWPALSTFENVFGLESIIFWMKTLKNKTEPKIIR